MTANGDLIRRIEAGERWPDDNIEVLRALGWYECECDGRKTGEWSDPNGYWGWPDRRPLPQPLDSFDDALGVKPEGWFVTMCSERPRRWTWHLARHFVNWPGKVRGRAPTAAAALVAAILRAKEAR